MAELENKTTQFDASTDKPNTDTNEDESPDEEVERYIKLNLQFLYNTERGYLRRYNVTIN